MFINCCAKNRKGERFPTKKSLKEALKADPTEVLFEKTSIFDGEGLIVVGNEIPDGTILSVVGPDAWKNRKWYASVSQANGKVVLR